METLSKRQTISTKTIVRTQNKSAQNTNEQELMIRLLMLSIEIDRKDNIIRQLLELVAGDDSRRVIEEWSHKCGKYEVQVKTLAETINMLKENISILETKRTNDTYNNYTHLTHINQDLEQKVKHLQNVLKRTQEEKIQLEEKMKENKLNQSMVEFKLLKNQQNQKGRIRQLEGMLVTERSRAQMQRRTLNQKNIVIEQLKGRIIEIESKQKLLVSQYEQRIKTIYNEVHFHDTLKKSQISTNEERLSATFQQVQALAEQVRNLKQINQNLRETVHLREKELAQITAQFRACENRLIKCQSDYKQIGLKLQARNQQLRLRDKESVERDNHSRKYVSQVQQLRMILNNRNQEVQMYEESISGLKAEVSQLIGQIDDYKLQIRKLRRRPMGQSVICQGCKIRDQISSTTIGSQKSIRGLNIGQIIHQTEQLIKSNKKIQSLISRHENVYDSSVHVSYER